MFPAPRSQIVDFDIKSVTNQKYKDLLQREQRIIAMQEKTIIESAKTLYAYKLEHKNSTNLEKRCNDFLLLEAKAAEYSECKK